MRELVFDCVNRRGSFPRRQRRQMADRGVGELDLVRHYDWLPQRMCPANPAKANALAMSRAVSQASAPAAGSAQLRSHARAGATAGVPERENLDSGRIGPDAVVQMVVNSTQVNAPHAWKACVLRSCADPRLKRDETEHAHDLLSHGPGAAGRLASHHSEAFAISPAARRVTLIGSGLVTPDRQGPARTGHHRSHPPGRLLRWRQEGQPRRRR